MELGVGKKSALGLQPQPQHAKEENASHLQRLEEARRDFTAELDKLRAATVLADERFRAAETPGTAGDRPGAQHGSQAAKGIGCRPSDIAASSGAAIA